MAYEDVREWHYIKALTTTRIPRRIVCVDCETHGEDVASKPGRKLHRLKLWVACTWRTDWQKGRTPDYHDGTVSASFWSFLESVCTDRNVTWVFAHNIGFDATVLDIWQKATRGDIEFVQHDNGQSASANKGDKLKWCGVAVVDDPPTILKFRFKGTRKTVVFVDTYNYYRKSLYDIAEAMGETKMTMPGDVASDSDWLEYCYHDVKILAVAVKAIVAMVSERKLGSMPYTASGLAMNAYRAAFISRTPGILIHGDAMALELEREAHHGGLCQCFYRGNVSTVSMHDWDSLDTTIATVIPRGPVYNLDVQSHYPALMAQHEYPHKLLRCYNKRCGERISLASCTQNTIARVWIDCGFPGYPVTRKDNTFMACGRFITTLCGDELIRAVYSGHVQRVDCIAEYAMADLFSEFVYHFYDMRKMYEQHGNGAMASVCKLLLNSLYGRFAQWRFKWVEKPDMLAPLPFGYWNEKVNGDEETRLYRALGWLPQLQRGRGESPDSFPAISSFVTSYGREKMLLYITTAGQENVYYSDTDSIHCNEKAYSILRDCYSIQADRLGMLRLVSVYDEVKYIGPKQYIADGVPTIAGVKKTALEVKPGIYKQPRFERLSSILHDGGLPQVAVDDQEIELRPWQPDGGVNEFGRVLLPELKEW